MGFNPLEHQGMPMDKQLRSLKAIASDRSIEPIARENKEYVRNVLAQQVDLTFLGTEPVTETHRRFEEYQNAALADGAASEEVIELNTAKQGRDYRIETEGPKPVERLRTENYPNNRNRATNS